jgi:hypothetical protein
MFDVLYTELKAFLRPLTQKRRLLERAKYAGAKILSSQEGNDLLARLIHAPAAVGKMGAVELGVVRPYIRRGDLNGQSSAWRQAAVQKLYRNAGVYPPETRIVSRFCRTYTEALGQLNVLGVYFSFGEHAAQRKFAPNAVLMDPVALEPYYHERPWSRQLEGKRVVVISPFAETIESQYRRRHDVWRGKPEVLPEFDLRAVRCPLSAYLAAPPYPDWFAALEAMREQMALATFDVALVGAGAWSLELLGYAKSLGACGLHLGGVTQMLFGVKGRRWERNQPVTAFYNEAWTRPSASETPPGIRKIEGGCYW